MEAARQGEAGRLVATARSRASRRMELPLMLLQLRSNFWVCTLDVEEGICVGWGLERGLVVGYKLNFEVESLSFFRDLVLVTACSCPRAPGAGLPSAPRRLTQMAQRHFLVVSKPRLLTLCTGGRSAVLFVNICWCAQEV
jgi:hypothetical protein